MSKEKKLIKNTFIIAIGNMCTKIISFFMLPLYTTLLTTSEYGTVDLISTIVSLLTAVLTLQFEQGLFRYLIEVREEKNKQEEYITTSFFTIVSLNVVFSAILLPILIAIKYEYAFYLILWTGMTALNYLMLQIPRGIGNNIVYAIGSCINGSLNVILNVIFIAILRWGIKGMLLANILSLIVTVIFIFVKLKLWKYIKINKYNKECLYKLIKYSLPLIPSNLCWWIVNASDRLIIQIFIGVSANGIYSIASKFPSLFSLVTNIFETSWTESAAENVNDKDRKKYFNNIMNNSIKFYSSCNLMIIAVLPILFNLLIKNDFIKAYNYIPILMLAALFHSIANLYGGIYTAFKLTKEVAKTTILAAIINIVINVIFINKIGLYAAAISTLVAYLLITIVRHIYINKKTKIEISKGFLIIEVLIYVIVLLAYYSRIKILQVIIVILLLPYCLFQNKVIVLSILKTIKSKIKGSHILK